MQKKKKWKIPQFPTFQTLVRNFPNFFLLLIPPFGGLLTFELLLPGAPGDEDEECKEVPEGDSSPSPHQAEDLL